MSYADEKYVWNLHKILTFGSIETGNVRAKWPDGEPAPTIKLTDVCTKYDISKEFPILTCRQVNIYKALDEMMWIYQKKSNNIHDLNSHVWDAWADANGSVGKTYGFQAGQKYQFPEGFMDQVDRVLYLLKNNPMSRHMIINLWNPADYSEMRLAPCCCWLQFNVVDDSLDMVLYQRSLDMITAGGWDVAAHALLQMMFAHCSGLQPGKFTHFVSNMHIYDRHIPIAKKLVNNFNFFGSEGGSPFYQAPQVVLKSDTSKNFYEIRPDQFVLASPYQFYKMEKFEVAV